MPDPDEKPEQPSGQLYDVTIYATVRVTVKGIVADSQQEAMHEAESGVDLDRLFPEITRGDMTSGYADEITGYLVDEQGDDAYLKTREYDSDKKQINHSRTGD